VLFAPSSESLTVSQAHPKGALCRYPPADATVPLDRATLPAMASSERAPDPAPAVRLAALCAGALALIACGPEPMAARVEPPVGPPVAAKQLQCPSPPDVAPRLRSSFTRFPATLAVTDCAVLMTWPTSFAESDEIAAEALPKDGSPSLLYRTPGWPGSDCIAADGENLYWTYLAGSSERCIALDGKHVYWPDTERGLILRVPTAGGKVEALAGGAKRPSTVAVSGGQVYWASLPEALLGDLRPYRTHPLAGVLLKMPLGGGPVTVLGSGRHPPLPPSPVLPSVIACEKRGCVLSVPAAGGTPRVVWMNPATPGLPGTLPVDLAVDETGIYIATNGSLLRLPSGGGPETVLVTGLQGAVGVTVDRGEVIWGEVNGAFDEAGHNVNGPTLRKIAVSGGEPVVLLRGSGVDGLVLDSRYIYVNARGEVLSIPR
jgi:hypothetical protein